MYHPYLRGKQYDLLSVRDQAPVLKAADFCPVIEPVRETLSGLEKTLEAIIAEEGRAVVIVNPHHGDLSGIGQPLTDLLKTEFVNPGISAGILLTNRVSLKDALSCMEAHQDHMPVFIHAGFTEPKGLSQELERDENRRHIFFARLCGKLYQKNFTGASRILLRDGFVRRKRNSDYPFVEPFSDLHATFPDEGMNGFGDFSIVGDDFSESGGPAYAVAIHLTYIDSDQDDAMYIHHFVSRRQDTPTDPAGKFAEALDLMMRTVDKTDSKILETEAVKEFRSLHRDGHFPGLGYVKKLSMNHHVETLAHYFQNQK